MRLSYNTVHRVLAFSLIALLQACAGMPASKPANNSATQTLNRQHLQKIAVIEQFTLQGRIGVQAEGTGFSGGLSWQHNRSNDDLALYSPLGGQVASIKQTVDKVTLEDSKGNTLSAANAEALTQTVLGWKLPLAGLADWSLGRPSSRIIQASTWDDQGHLSTLKQDNWEIQYQNYSEQNGYFLPSKIILRNEKVHLKLLVETWGNLTTN